MELTSANPKDPIACADMNTRMEARPSVGARCAGVRSSVVSSIVLRGIGRGDVPEKIKFKSQGL